MREREKKQHSYFKKYQNKEFSYFIIYKKKERDGIAFTYGTTNSGKTFTILGNQSEMGLVQLSLLELYQYVDEINSTLVDNIHNFEHLGNSHSSSQSQSKIIKPCDIPRIISSHTVSNLSLTGLTLQLSVFEIYNERIIDLIEPSIDLKCHYEN